MDIPANVIGNEREFPKGLPDTTLTQFRAFRPELIDRLFARFSAMYGSKFFDMWANSNLDEVKQCWSYELRLFSVDHVGVAVDGLKRNNFPPTLPEFLSLCEMARKDKPRLAEYQSLPRKTANDNQSEEWHAAKARFMATVKAAQPHKANNEWANKILARFSFGESVSADSLRMARAAML